MNINLLLLLFSLSIRSPNLENVSVFDYEVMLGLRGNDNKIAYVYERENGRQYFNSDIALKYKYFEFTNYIKSAKKIDSQKFSFLYPSWEGIKVGLSYSLEDWGDPNILFTVVAKSEIFSIRYSEGVSRVSIDVSLKKSFQIKNRVNLVPTISLRKYNSILFYQAKVGFEYIIRLEKEER